MVGLAVDCRRQSAMDCMPLEVSSADWHFCCSCTRRSSQSRSDLGWARGHPSWQMHLLTKKQLSSEIEGRCSAAAVLLFSCNLFRFFANLLSSTLSRQGLLHPALCARLQVEGVALHFLNDVFRLNLALESTERVLYGLAFLQPNFCQTHHLPTRSKSEIPEEPTLFVARSGERIAK